MKAIIIPIILFLIKLMIVHILFLSKFQYIRRLTIKQPAYLFEGGKAYCLCLIVFEYRKIGGSDTHFIGKLHKTDFSLCHHNIYVYYNRHSAPPISSGHSLPYTALPAGTAQKEETELHSQRQTLPQPAGQTARGLETSK